ncbi:uncharacterized protein LOC111356813 [Spodoptera litura]|uniref:Uncharacterized protein LOC111356813 n=1 Tax=Spodoptera litura TaxID=69820 RepID=A0A9J7IT47_SPOLT|nr:uncharacterized protein LOC111356813 [Spodoptera litura]
MTDTRDYHHHPSSVFSTDTMKLTSSASEQNVYFTYVCLVNDIKPSGNLTSNFKTCDKLSAADVSSTLNAEVNQEEQTIQVERSKALHELLNIESYKKADLGEEIGERNDAESSKQPTTSGEDSELSENDENNFLPCDNPNVLKLTKMKWLSEDQEDGHNSSSPSVSPVSSSSNCSKISEEDLKERNEMEDKYLSTILRLDKEHNMFGLSNIAIVGAKQSKIKRKDDEKAVFHQTAIVQVCCGKSCCKHKSNTDLPASLKCGTCPRGRCSCKYSRPTSRCAIDCNNCYGLKIKVNRKPKFDDPVVELTPRSSCVLHKPMAARSCHHLPQCIPPSSCFPYLMPCYWPSRPSAPCATPTHCFHNPPCPPAKKRQRVPVPPEYICPEKCVDDAKNTKCPNDQCPGNNPLMRSIIEKRFKEVKE